MYWKITQPEDNSLGIECLVKKALKAISKGKRKTGIVIGKGITKRRRKLHLHWLR